MIRHLSFCLLCLIEMESEGCGITCKCYFKYISILINAKITVNWSVDSKQSFAYHVTVTHDTCFSSDIEFLAARAAQ